jgi:hypothetical protein
MPIFLGGKIGWELLKDGDAAATAADTFFVEECKSD